MSSLPELEDAILRVSIGLNSRSVSFRIQSVVFAKEQLKNGSFHQKPGQMKRLLKDILLSLIENFYNEKKWKNELHSMIVSTCSANLPFDVLDFIVDDCICSDLFVNKLSNCLPKTRFAFIDLCIFMLRISLGCGSGAEIDYHVDNPDNIRSIRLISVIGEQLEVLSGECVNNEASLLKSERAFAQVLANVHRTVIPLFIAGWVHVRSEKGPQLAASSILMGFLWRFRSDSNFSQYFLEVKVFLMDVYRKRFGTAKQSAGLTCSAWTRILSFSVGTAEWNSVDLESLQSLVLKTMKKAPEGSSHSVSVLLHGLDTKIELNEFVKNGGILCVIRMLKSGEENVRLAAVDIVQSVCGRCTSASALQTVTSQLLEALAGKGVGGILTQTYQKLAMWQALRVCADRVRVCTALDRESLAVVAGSVVALAPPLLEKETDGAIRLLAADTLGKWLGLCVFVGDLQFPFFLSCVQSSLEKFVAAPASPQGSAAASYLLALNVAVRFNDELLNELEKTLLPSLVTLVKEAVKKTVVANSEAVLALTLVLGLTNISSNALALFDSSKLWATVALPSSFLFSKVLQQQLISPRRLQDVSSSLVHVDVQLSKDFVALERLGAELYAREVVVSVSGALREAAFSHPEVLVSAFVSDSAKMVTFEMLNFCQLYGDLSTRQIVTRDVQKIVEFVPALADTFVANLWTYLEDCGKQMELYKQAAMSDFKNFAADDGDGKNTASGSKLSVPFVAPQSYLIAALTACLIGIVNASEATVARSLLAASHPFVSGSRSKSALLWKSWGLPVTSKTADAIAAVIDAASVSSVNSTRFAAQTALFILHSAATNDAAAQVINKVVTRSIHRLRCSQIQTMSANDVLIFIDPESAIAEFVLKNSASTSASAVEVQVTNADRKKTAPRSSRRGQFGADVLEDEDWAERLKKEKVDKLTQSKTAENTTAHEKAIQYIAAARSVIKSDVDSVSFSLELLHAVAQISVAASRWAICQIFETQTMQVLLRSPLSQDAACKALYSLTEHALEPELKGFARDAVDSLRVVVQQSAVAADLTLLSDGDLQDAYRRITRLSAPILRLLRGVQVVLNRRAPSAESVANRMPLSPSTIHVLLPVIMEVLVLQAVIPGSEMAFYLLDTLWPSANHFLVESDNVTTLRALQKSLFAVVLRVMARPLKVDPAPDKVFLRIATQLTPLTPLEWGVLTSSLGLLSPETKIRITCWQAVERLVCDGIALSTLDIDVLATLWLGVHDDNESVRALAQSVWADSSLLSVAFTKPLVALLVHSLKSVREAAARAIAGLVRFLSTFDAQSSWTVIAQIQQLYTNNAPIRPAVPSLVGKLSSSGKGAALLAPLIKKPSEDLTVGLRISIAQTFLAIGAQKAIRVENETVLCDLVRFILQSGVVDLHVEVRAAMLLAGKSLIDCHGRELCGALQRLLEEVLANKHLPQEDTADFDHRHSAAVVLLGATGRHLEKGDPSILVIAVSLVEALKTPSESVQRAVADCLAPLLQIMKGSERADELLEALLSAALEGSSYGDRRGAAFGLSAVIKGLGIPSLKQHDVVTRLKEACTNGSINSKQGSLFAFECLSERLGLLFEPYIIVVVPIMLKSFSHSSEHVRDAAQGAAMVIMSRLSAHGVKQVLTPILTTLPVEPAWKSRQEAIRLLGMMAHCAPKQLAACLPQIVTCLVDAGSSDPHPKVKESAKAAMTDISSVIRNPEVARLSPVLLLALADPANRTKEALEALLECEFMHSIDAPSLALLVPILGRALRDRGADLKRKAAAITGNIMTMVSEPSALAPYLPQVLPGLKDCLMDPIPDVRASSAKALGSLFSGVGEEQLGDLVPWLMAALRSEVSPVERSGAAQGLSEICGHAMGPARVEQILLLVMKMKEEAQSAPREGLLWFLSFLPMALNEGFAPYISVSLPVILSGLSDDNDGVREVAMRAGQVVVSKLGLNHTLKLLPSLAEGMFHDDWRIRQSSVKLLGELLYLVGDTKAVGLADGEDDDEEMGAGNGTGGSTSRVAITIRAHIGEKHTNEVLASIYIVRSDVATAVRQSALQIWKSIVSNTPRTLVEIMPVLVLQLIAKLSSDSEELRLVAGRALGELVRKLGDRVLPVIVPHIRQGLRSSHESMRQGACSGLSEILTACTKKQAEDYIEVLMPALRQALCDISSNVCVQAAQAFMTLFKTVGAQAIDEVVPALLDTLASGSDEAELALRGLREIVQLRPRDLVEYLLPTLLVSPMEYVSARALGSVADVAGTQFNYHFQTLVPGLVHELYGATDKIEKLKVRLELLEMEGAGDSMEDGDDADLAGELIYETERFDAIKEAAAAVMASATSSGVHLLISELGKQIEHETNVKRRRWGCWLAEQFISRSKADYEDYVPLLLKFILSRVAELDKVLLQAVSDCLLAISVSLPLEELAEHMSFICSCISSAASAARHRTGTSKLLTASGEFLLPLLTLPKSFDPLLNIALYGLMNGSANVRAACAEAIGELAVMTDATVLKPVLIKTTGPLIRVIGDRYPSNVKAAILQALIVLLEKGGASLKAFAPQLQTTFVKSLSDPSREVRLRGGAALGKLMVLSLRIDPLLVELSGICLLADSNAIKGSVLDAISSVMVVGGDKATATALEKVKTVVLQNIGDEDENIRAVTARCIGSLAVLSDASQVTDLLLDLFDGGRKDSRGESASQVLGRLMGVAAVLQSAGQRAVEMRDEAFLIISAGMRDERSSVKVAACGAVATMILPPSHSGWMERKDEYRKAAQATIHAFASALGVSAQDPHSGEVRTGAITAIKQAAKFYFGAAVQHLKDFLPAINLALKDINIQVKYIAERALKHLSEGGTGTVSVAPAPVGGNAAFSTQLSTFDAETGRFVRDYLKRVVSRLPADSDDESGADKW